MLHRTADTNKFLRADAYTALSNICTNIHPHRAINLLATKGAVHQNAVVKCTTARLISEMVQRLGYARIFGLPHELRDRVVLTSANLLTEGSLETR